MARGSKAKIRNINAQGGVPDLITVTDGFGVKTVEFKIGSELDFLNRTLAALRGIKRGLNLKNVDWLLPMSRGLVYAASLFGTSQRGVMVEVSAKNQTQKMSMSVFATDHGEVIPAFLPSLATEMLLRGEIMCRGVVAFTDWLPRERFLDELSKRKLEIARKTAQTWVALNIMPLAST